MYLYGAQIFGIQSFILSGNKLTSIIDRSAVVEEICTNLFDSCFNIREENILTMAAGKVTCFIDTEEDCIKVVREFPKKVMQLAPGVTVSQAVVPYEEPFKDSLNLLAGRLRQQRNIPDKSLTTGLMGMRRSRNTGELVVKRCVNRSDKIKNPDYLNLLLCEKSFGLKLDNRILTRQHEEISNEESWMAVIHADGNGMGSIVDKVSEDPVIMKKFSDIISESSKNAAHKAFKFIQNKYNLDKEFVLQLRPVVLNGDDMTMICRADLALEYTKVYCQQFEEEMNKALTEPVFDKVRRKMEDGLPLRMSASAGIVYVKDHYPYFAAYNLAEGLCSKAKDCFRSEKTNMPGAIMIHKVSDSFSENYAEIMHRELALPGKGSWSFGPYLINSNRDGYWSVDELIEKSQYLNSPENNAFKNALREWIGYKHRDEGKYSGRAELFEYTVVEKYSSTTSGKSSDNKHRSFYSGIFRDKLTRYPTYDILNIAIMNAEASAE